MQQFGSGLLAIITLIFVLAIISVLVSKSSSTPSVIQAFGSLLSNVIAAAVKPPTGGASTGSNAQSAPWYSTNV